ANDGVNWTAVSPVFSTSPQPGIVTTPGEGMSGMPLPTGVNVITTIAIAPNDPNRVYVGLYGGEIFTSSAPCATMSCWTKVSSGLPAAPVTRIAVDPTAASTAYATFSGFGSGAHVWKTTNTGGAWTAVASGLPAGVPANTITVEPGTPANLWLGLDSTPDGNSVYKSTNGGSSWMPFSAGLPNAPVYEISIDEVRGRVYAATHGRGA